MNSIVYDKMISIIYIASNSLFINLILTSTTQYSYDLIKGYRSGVFECRASVNLEFYTFKSVNPKKYATYDTNGYTLKSLA